MYFELTFLFYFYFFFWNVDNSSSYAFNLHPVIVIAGPSSVCLLSNNVVKYLLGNLVSNVGTTVKSLLDIASVNCRRISSLENSPRLLFTYVFILLLTAEREYIIYYTVCLSFFDLQGDLCLYLEQFSFEMSLISYHTTCW